MKTALSLLKEASWFVRHSPDCSCIQQYNESETCDCGFLDFMDELNKFRDELRIRLNE